jgi:ATP-dependent Zn protease
VKSILDHAYAEAKDILQLHRDQMEQVTQNLLAVETIDAATFQKLIGQDLKNDERPSQTPVS